ncbi:CLUMA_CG007089, isoform A [Clunio marinus]|uniref:CLUMA_CG007089, isoform A n=1 Tax=Clunio marinus TaxID=568069 RepID=A0A1J1I1U0_9DIPT|nr:CLUMA_CG007089, isoform A [Clunio marinus]
MLFTVKQIRGMPMVTHAVMLDKQNDLRETTKKLLFIRNSTVTLIIAFGDGIENFHFNVFLKANEVQHKQAVSINLISTRDGRRGKIINSLNRMTIKRVLNSSFRRKNLKCDV